MTDSSAFERGHLKFSEPVGLRDNFNGPQVGISLGRVFGKGY